MLSKLSVFVLAATTGFKSALALPANGDGSLAPDIGPFTVVTVCRNVDFDDCVDLGPQYLIPICHNLPPSLDNTISSAKIGEFLLALGGGSCTFFTDKNCKGSSLVVDPSNGNFDDQGFNDVASSINLLELNRVSPAGLQQRTERETSRLGHPPALSSVATAWLQAASRASRAEPAGKSKLGNRLSRLGYGLNRLQVDLSHDFRPDLEYK
ncbi:hypothetical protein C8J57DRAFT_1246929 [Mycena rebaudengoi]|nr:hypothetical protein C8J57DRAFT_1246929 [Mycena rebaudengoi]